MRGDILRSLVRKTHRRSLFWTTASRRWSAPGKQTLKCFAAFIILDDFRARSIIPTRIFHG